MGAGTIMAYGKKRGRKERGRKAANVPENTGNAYKNDSEGASLIKKMAHDGAVGTKIMVHNGIIAAVYLAAAAFFSTIMLDAAYACTGLAIAYSGAMNLATVADMLTMYVTIIMVCGFCLVTWYHACKALMKAMIRRFWKKDRATGEIGKGCKSGKRMAPEPAGTATEPK